jgi:hypothetical protein
MGGKAASKRQASRAGNDPGTDWINRGRSCGHGGSLKVKNWLAGKDEQIEIFHLPPYSPELNPDAHLNCDLKAASIPASRRTRKVS